MSTATDPPVIKSSHLHSGDRIIIEAKGVPDFEATVILCLGWSLVHNVMMWQCRRDNEDESFVYDIHIDTPVRLVQTK